MSYQYWSEQEQDFLRANWGYMPEKELCRWLNRSRASIQARATRLHLTKRPARRWTEEELEIVRTWWWKKTPEEIAEMVGRGLDSVCNKAYELGFKKRRDWTEEDCAYLDENWGKKSLGTIARHLGRSESAVKQKAGKRKLGAFLDSGDYVTLNQLMKALTGTDAYHSYQMKSWVKERGLPVRTKKVGQCSFRVVSLDDFWKWAEQHRGFLDFSRMEENILGMEPAWVKEQRRLDVRRASLIRTTPWTPAEDKRLTDLLKQHRYSYLELSQMLGRTSGAIQRRICSLGLRERPVKAEVHNKWTAEDLERFTCLIQSGMDYELMSMELGRSAKALRGKCGLTYRTENLDSIIAMMDGGSWGAGAPEPTVKYCFRKTAVREELSRLCRALQERQRQSTQTRLAYIGYWQKGMCRWWDNVEGCTVGETDCDACASFRRIQLEDIGA